jgi:hypothetical protein
VRTTVDLPSDLMRAAKARSAEGGESLKTLLTRALAAELDTQVVRRSQNVRVMLPQFGGSSGSRIRLTNADLERALAEADVLASSPSVSSGAERLKRRRRRSK